MSDKNSVLIRKGLRKEFDNKTFHLGKSWDLTHGKGWFCHIYNDLNWDIGFGFHKTNKFTAVRIALEQLNKTK